MAIRHITIDRQYGSGGREIGRLVANQLNIPFYDKELLLIAADRFGLNPGVLKEHDEGKTGSLLYNIALFANSMHNYDKVSEPYEIFEAECTTIRRLAEEGPCVFIGRCAEYALETVSRPVHAFIYASSNEEKAERAFKEDHIERRNIDSYIKKKDMQRKTYYEFFTERQWGKLENYDLCLNSSRLGYQGCTDIIKELAVR